MIWKDRTKTNVHVGHNYSMYLVAFVPQGLEIWKDSTKTNVLIGHNYIMYLVAFISQGLGNSQWEF